MRLEGHTRTCTGVLFPLAPPSWMPPCIVSCGADCSVRVWNLAQRRSEHDTGMLGASAICTLTQLPSHTLDELRVACGTLDSRVFVFALKAWAGAGESNKMFLHLLFTVDTAPMLKRLFSIQEVDPAGAAPRSGGSPTPVVRVKAPTRRTKRTAPVQHASQWDDSTVIPQRSAVAASPSATSSAASDIPPAPLLTVQEVTLPARVAAAERATASRWSGGSGMFGKEPAMHHAQPAAEADALPAWAQPAASAQLSAPTSATVAVPAADGGTTCLLVATPFHVMLVSKLSNKVLFAAATCDLVGGGEGSDAADGSGMLTHVLQTDGMPALLLGDQDYPVVYKLQPLCMPHAASAPAAQLRWLDAADTTGAGSRAAAQRVAEAQASLDPTLPSWLQSPTAAPAEPVGFATPASNGAQAPPLTLFPAGQLPLNSPLRAPAAPTPQAGAAMSGPSTGAVSSLPPRRRATGGAAAGSKSAASRGLSAGAAKAGRSVRPSGYGSLKPRALFGTDARGSSKRSGSHAPQSCSLAQLAYPSRPAAPGKLDTIGTASLEVLCHLSSASPPPAAVSSSGFFASARSAARGMGITSAQWSATGNSLCVGYADGSVATASMPSAWRKAVLQGDTALAVQCAAAVRRYSTQSSRPARAVWSHHTYSVAAGRQLKQAAGGSSADLLGSQRDVLQAGASAPLLVGWGSGSAALHVWGTAADVPLLVMDAQSDAPPGCIVDAGFVYGDAALAVAREGHLHLHRLLLREGVDSTASAAAGLQQRHPRGNKSKLLCSCALTAGDAGKITALATMNEPRATLAVAATSDRSLQVVDLAVGAVALTLREAHTRAAHALALPSSSHAAVLAPAGLHTLLSAAPSDSAAVAAAGRAANSGVLVWDLRCSGGSSSAPVASLSGHSHRSAAHSGALALSPCGQYVAVGSDDNAAYIYDLRMCIPLHDDTGHSALGSCSFLSKLRGARDTVSAVAFNPHAPCLATAGLDGVIRLYSEVSS